MQVQQSMPAKGEQCFPRQVLPDRFSQTGFPRQVFPDRFSQTGFALHFKTGFPLRFKRASGMGNLTMISQLSEQWDKCDRFPNQKKSLDSAMFLGYYILLLSLLTNSLQCPKSPSKLEMMELIQILLCRFVMGQVRL